ncbi:MAG: biotin/lipoyl-containing protein [Pyrinomonadaceae bacterium]
MILKAEIGGTEREISVNQDRTEILVDGESRGFVVSEPEPGVFLFKTDRGTFEAVVSNKSGAGEFAVAVGGREYDVNVIDPKRMMGAGAGVEAADGVVEIKSAMPGKVVKLNVSEGDEVQSGQAVIVVEAMKMQNELKSPKEGVVRKINVGEDDRVDAGEVLIVIE